MCAERFDERGRPTPAALEEEKRLQERFPGYRGVDDDYVHAGEAALERWRDLKFGIRIHWSIYSVTGIGPESWSLTTEQGGTPGYREQYERLARWWNPRLFDADEWADMMVRSGLKFFTFTAKHHDGFSMFDTRTRVKRRLVHTGPDAGRIVDCDLRYSIAEGPFGRDVVGELVAAGRRRGLGIGIYFSHIDWFDSDFRIDEWNYQRDGGYTRGTDPEGFERMLARHREQIRELCSNYGKLDLLSFDMHFPADELGIRREIIDTVKMARRLQPEMLMRHRGIGPYGDYCTPERVIPEGADEVVALEKPWQVIYPGGKHFSHVWNDEYKDPRWILENLIDVAAKGGNFQVGFGPLPTGEWPVQVVGRLEEVGRWLRVNGEAIYGTRSCRVFREGADVRFTRSKDGKYVYAVFLRWPPDGFALKSVRLKSVRPAADGRVTMLGVEQSLKWSRDERYLEIEIPEALNDEANRPCAGPCVFKIEVER